MNSLEKAKIVYSVNGKYKCYYTETDKIEAMLELLFRIYSKQSKTRHDATIRLMCIDRVAERINKKFNEIKMYGCNK